MRAALDPGAVAARARELDSHWLHAAKRMLMRAPSSPDFTADHARLVIVGVIETELARRARKETRT